MTSVPVFIGLFQTFLQFNFPHFLIVIASHCYRKWFVSWDLFQPNQINVFDPMLQTLCFLLDEILTSCTYYSSAKVAIDWWWRVNPSSAWQRGGYSPTAVLHICTQAQGPDNCVSFPSNKRSFERRWCVLLCVTVLPGEVVFVLFFCFVLLFCSLNVLFPSFALWVFRRVAGV